MSYNILKYIYNWKGPPGALITHINTHTQTQLKDPEKALKGSTNYNGKANGSQGHFQEALTKSEYWSTKPLIASCSLNKALGEV